MVNQSLYYSLLFTFLVLLGVVDLQVICQGHTLAIAEVKSSGIGTTQLLAALIRCSHTQRTMPIGELNLRQLACTTSIIGASLSEPHIDWHNGPRRRECIVACMQRLSFLNVPENTPIQSITRTARAQWPMPSASHDTITLTNVLQEWTMRNITALLC